MFIHKFKLLIGADTPYADTIPVQTYLVHPSYQSDGNINDISIVYTQQIMNYSPGVGPACLPTAYSPLDGQYVEVVGWGSLFFAGPTSDRLKKATLQVISNDQCRSYYGNVITYSQMCTLAYKTDACQVIHF